MNLGMNRVKMLVDSYAESLLLTYNILKHSVLYSVMDLLYLAQVLELLQNYDSTSGGMHKFGRSRTFPCVWRFQCVITIVSLEETPKTKYGLEGLFHLLNWAINDTHT